MRPRSETRLLLVDDDPDLVALTKKRLEKYGFVVACADNAEAALLASETDNFDAVVTDLSMPGMTGIELTERLSQNRPSMPVIVMTSFGDLDTAIAAIRAGAYDFITKPIELKALLLALERAVQFGYLREEVRVLRHAARNVDRFESLKGESQAMRGMYEIIAKAAETDVTVLITGESGTGKELIARALHDRSSRRSGPFVAVNCSALPENLLESELFGHVKGAFTDAKTARTGLFAQAREGTIFLDEIGDMPLGLQAKILRALEARKIRPIGGSAEVAYNARIVAATNRNLATAVKEKLFREDLFYRLNVVQIAVPPLSERGRDILLLAQHFIEQFSTDMKRDVAGLTTAAAARLLAYHWPGNVRELRNCVEQSVALSSTNQITVDDLPEHIRGYKANHVLVSSADPSDLVPLEVMEQRYIKRVLDAVHGNKAMAARILGLHRKTLYRKLEHHGLIGTDKSE
ncbi:MAG: sigma-54 dependent transcriptional regulator [Myxococcota bacterium]|nr:sigma-54 dependent transcriptional regulator [Myxococcota bacterium]